MYCMRIGKGMQHGDPVAELVLRMEPDDPLGRRQANQLREPLRRSSLLQKSSEPIDGFERTIAEKQVYERLLIQRVGRRRGRSRKLQLFERLFDGRDEIDRRLPMMKLFAARRRTDQRNERGENRLREPVAQSFQRFERLIVKIEGMPAV